MSGSELVDYANWFQSAEPSFDHRFSIICGGCYGFYYYWVHNYHRFDTIQIMSIIVSRGVFDDDECAMLFI